MAAYRRSFYDFGQICSVHLGNFLADLNNFALTQICKKLRANLHKPCLNTGKMLPKYSDNVEACPKVYRKLPEIQATLKFVGQNMQYLKTSSLNSDFIFPRDFE